MTASGVDSWRPPGAAVAPEFRCGSSIIRRRYRQLQWFGLRQRGLLGLHGLSPILTSRLMAIRFSNTQFSILILGFSVDTQGLRVRRNDYPQRGTPMDQDELWLREQDLGLKKSDLQETRDHNRRTRRIAVTSALVACLSVFVAAGSVAL